MFINKQEYNDYEKEIGDVFYNDKHLKTKLLPSNNNPSFIKTCKVTLNIDLIHSNGMSCSELIKQKQVSKLPNISHISLFHIGNQKLDKVKMGYDAEQKLFSFPACDFGGLTNYRQSIHDKNQFMKSKIKMTCNSSISKITNDVYNQWKYYSKKERFYGKMKSNLYLFLSSVFEYLQSQKEFTKAYLTFWKLPSVHKVVYTSYDIYDKMNTYYVRMYGSKYYAKKVQPREDLFCSVWKLKNGTIVITPNINKNNIYNEFQIYK